MARKNLFGFGKSKPAPAKKVKKSSMTLGAAMSAAFSAGKEIGDTGKFEGWLESKGLADRSDNVKERLESEFERGVKAPAGERKAAKAAQEAADWKAELEALKGKKIGTYSVKATADKIAAQAAGRHVSYKGPKRFEVWQNPKRKPSKGKPKKATSTKATSNPIKVATLKQGQATAVVTIAGVNKYRVTITKGSEKLEETFKGFKPAMTYARVRLHDVAHNPGGLKGIGKAIKRAAKSASQKFSAMTRKNPVAQAERTYEEFHGLPSQEVIEYQTSEHYHSVTASVGKLVCLQLIDINGKHLDIICDGFSWAGPKGELSRGAKMSKTSGWDFDPNTPIEDIVMLTTSEDGKQLFIQGGNQEVDVKALGFEDRDHRDHMLLGTIWRLWYRTRKSFEADGAETDYFHELGKEGSGGVCPVLIYKPRNPSLEVSGGRYYIAPPEAELGDASPGIVG